MSWSLNLYSCVVYQNYSDDLRSHSVQCNLVSWDQSMMEAMMHYTPNGGIQHNIEYTGGLGIVGNPPYEHPSAIVDDLINVDLFQQPDGLKYHEQPTQGLQHFFSPISSTLSEGSTSPSTSSEMMSVTGYPFPYMTPSSGSPASSSDVSWSPFLLSTFHSNLSKISPSPPSMFSSVPYISPEEPANCITTWDKYNTMGVSEVKPSATETPIYTRKQVKDMLDVVGDCFLETIVSSKSMLTQRHPLNLVFRMLSFREHKRLTCP